MVGTQMEKPIRFDALDALVRAIDVQLGYLPKGDPLLDAIGSAMLDFRRAEPEEPQLLDIPDIQEAFALLNERRINPIVGTGGACMYADPVTGRPSCIAGAILAILVPEFFGGLKAGTTNACGSLPGIDRFFTQRAITLLGSAQRHADGWGGYDQLDWGDAMQAARFEVLSTNA